VIPIPENLQNLLYYLPAGFSGAGASAGFSGAGAGASAGFGVSAGFSAFLQPTPSENDTNSISDKSITKNFFITVTSFHEGFP
jgi:hypothetical protein